ncbi:unnamed protein product [Lactuca virosa]|uniref:Uncharacterized protein n=1 Tax=Lactuca virosa TaxID=75947 RepID=A0AAU9LTK7_9ASTR|nr:unnamed protein product [Lactuca virosa]
MSIHSTALHRLISLLSLSFWMVILTSDLKLPFTVFSVPEDFHQPHVSTYPLIPFLLYFPPSFRHRHL